MTYSLITVFVCFVVCFSTKNSVETAVIHQSYIQSTNNDNPSKQHVQNDFKQTFFKKPQKSSIDTFYDILRETAYRMKADKSIDPLALKSHVLSFDDGFISGNVTFTGQQFKHLANFKTSSVTIDWHSLFLWITLRVDMLGISSVFHIDGSFDEFDFKENGISRGEVETVESTDIEVLGYSSMKYSDIEIYLNAQLTHNADGFLQIRGSWTNMDFWTQSCQINSYFPSEWAQHLICSFDEWNSHFDEMTDKINDYLVKDINRQMIQRNMKKLHFIDEMERKQ